MGIGNRIKEARETLGLTQTELGEMIGVTGSAITNYEKETSHPKELIMYKLIEALKVDANYLFQDVVKSSGDQYNITIAEYNYIQKYRDLDSHGKKMVDFTLQEEWERSTATAGGQVLQFPDQEPDHLLSDAAHLRTDIDVQ